MKKDEETVNYSGSSKLRPARREPPPDPNPAQVALMVSIGFTAASLALLIYAACKYESPHPKREDQLVPQDQPVK